MVSLCFFWDFLSRYYLAITIYIFAFLNVSNFYFVNLSVHVFIIIMSPDVIVILNRCMNYRNVLIKHSYLYLDLVIFFLDNANVLRG